MTLPFENDTREITYKIASAKLKHDKLKKRTSIFAVALAAMLMSTVLLVVSAIATVNMNGGNSITGSYHALISGISQKEFEVIKSEKETVLTGLTAAIGTSKSGNSQLNISYSNSDALTLNGLTVAEGKMPELENEILIEKDYLKYLGLNVGIGNTISIFMPDLQKEQPFTISGYLKTTASGTNRILYGAIVSEQYFRKHDVWNRFSPSAIIRITTGKATSKTDIEKIVTKIVQNARIEKKPFINEAYINLSKPSVFLIGAAIAGLAIIIIASVLVIYCIFYIAIINSIKEYGQLRTIGMTGKQIKRLVFREGFSLSVLSIPIGLALGTLFSYLLVPQGFQFTNLLWVWPLVSVLIYITVRLSIRKPAIIAATVSPIDAYRYSWPHTSKKIQSCHKRKLSPVILAKKHISDNKKKNVLTVISLVLTGILLLGLSSVLSSINAKDMSLSGFPRGQFIINISNEELRNHSLEQIQAKNPMDDNLRNSLENISGLKSITEYHYIPASFELEAEKSNTAISSFDREDIDLIQACTTEQNVLDYDKLAAKNQLIIGRPNDLEKDLNIQAEVGQIITLKIFDGFTSYNMDFEVGAVLDQNKIGNNGDKIDMLMLPLDAMNAFASCNTMYQYVIWVSDDLEEQARTEIEQILHETPKLHVSTLSDAIAQNENFIQGMKLALIAAVAFIGCFAVMNLVNTILTSIITRQKEFALMRSVGMSQKQLFSMVCCESLIAAMLGLLFSLVIGGSIGNVLCSILKNKLMSYLHYQFPFAIAAIYCLIVVICTFAITGAALKHQSKLSLIEQITRLDS